MVKRHLSREHKLVMTGWILNNEEKYLVGSSNKEQLFLKVQKGVISL